MLICLSQMALSFHWSHGNLHFHWRHPGFCRAVLCLGEQTARLFYDQSKTQTWTLRHDWSVWISEVKVQIQSCFILRDSDLIGRKQGLRELPEDHQERVV